MRLSFSKAISLEGQTALITGGATGIGLGIAQAYRAAGAQVVLIGRREGKLQEAVSQLGQQAHYRVHDVTELSASESLIDGIEKQHGPISILVNNAGINIKKPSEDLTDDEFRQILDVHVLGSYALSRQVARRMMKRDGGNLLFIASMASLFGIPYIAAYAAAKSAFLGIVRTLAVEWAEKGIRVNAIAPGWIKTDMTQKTVENDPERKAKILQRTPMHKMGTVEDIAWAATYLVSPAAGYVTGVCLPVDGGVSIGF